MSESADERPSFTVWCHPADEEDARKAAVQFQPELPGPVTVKVHPRVPEGGMFIVHDQSLPPGPDE